MARYRSALPQLTGDLFLTDGGIETTLVFHDGLDLPYFAAFDLLKHEDGRQALLRYFRSHASIASEYGVGFVLESATWRASADWGEKLGYSKEALAHVNRQAIAMLAEAKERRATRRRIDSMQTRGGRPADLALAVCRPDATLATAALRHLDVFRLATERQNEAMRVMLGLQDQVERMAAFESEAMRMRRVFEQLTGGW